MALLVALLGCISQCKDRASLPFRKRTTGSFYPVGSALINPAFVEMAKDLKVTVEQASYCTTVFILFGGVAPIFLVPFANVYGRRLLYVVSRRAHCQL